MSERQPDFVFLTPDDIISGKPGQNVRQAFDQKGLQQLADSITANGIIEPLIVREVRLGTSIEYHLVAGERRLRAAKIAGLKEVPVIVRYFDADTAAKVMLIENLQRHDLDPIEEARGYQRLIDDHKMRQARSRRSSASARATSRTAGVCCACPARCWRRLRAETSPRASR